MEEQIQSAAQQSIRNLITAELSKIQINCKNVSVIMDMDETSSIVINKVIVVLASGEETNIIRAQELSLLSTGTANGGDRRWRRRKRIRQKQCWGKIAENPMGRKAVLVIDLSA